MGKYLKVVILVGLVALMALVGTGAVLVSKPGLHAQPPGKADGPAEKKPAPADSSTRRRSTVDGWRTEAPHAEGALRLLGAPRSSCGRLPPSGAGG